MYEMFSHRTPYQDLPDSKLQHFITEMMPLIVDGSLRPTKLSPQHCPAGVWDLMEACWQSDPEKRPTMEKVRIRLQEIEEVLQAKVGVDENKSDVSGPRQTQPTSPPPPPPPPPPTVPARPDVLGVYYGAASSSPSPSVIETSRFELLLIGVGWAVWLLIVGGAQSNSTFKQFRFRFFKIYSSISIESSSPTTKAHLFPKVKPHTCICTRTSSRSEGHAK